MIVTIAKLYKSPDEEIYRNIAKYQNLKGKLHEVFLSLTLIYC